MSWLALHDFFEEHQGWILAFLGSLMGIIGASSIYVDVLIHLFNKKSTFTIKGEERVLIYGFSMSSGCLTLTSLYRLLPESFSYFEKSMEKEKGKFTPSFWVTVFFIGGTTFCLVFNNLVHYMTSESIVHCNHGGDGDEHTHSHSDTGDESLSPLSTKNHSHVHPHSHSNSLLHPHSHSSSSMNSSDDKIPTPNTGLLDEEQIIEYHGLQGSTMSGYFDDVDQPTENTPLVRPQLEHKKSIFEAAIDKITLGSHNNHECTGINDTNCVGYPTCITQEITDKVSNDIHHLDFYRGLQINKSMSSLVAYTQPSSNNVLRHQASIAGLPPVQIPQDITLSSEPNLDLHASHKDDHHHQINTPVSKLLSIGLQTCVALMLHKLPEGFITYATSEANPSLGIAIFLSLAIHNIIEGFSMTLPLYLALDSRTKAFGVSAILCGFSQPVGALLAFLVLRGRILEDEDSMFVFGSLIGVTSGFLMIVAMQMFSSAIQFGGSASQVMKWSVFGMLLILVTATMTEIGNT